MSAYTRGPVVILTAFEARVLRQEAKLDELRIKHRGEDSRFYKILHDIYQVSLLDEDVAAPGKQPRQSTANEKTEYTTVPQVARATRLSERTVRHHLQNRILPATKSDRGEWVITTADADTYIAARRKN